VAVAAEKWEGDRSVARECPGNAAILQDHCLRCHEAMVHELVAGARTDRLDRV
jgi:hypothetical protein